MKKLLLFVLVAIATTLSVSAANRMKKADFPRDQKQTLTAWNPLLGVVAKGAVNQMFQAKPAKVMKSVKRADEFEELPELIPAYSEWTYHYSAAVGGFIPQIMYEGASFLVQKDIALLKPFGNLPGVVYGQVESEVENRYSRNGADSITFHCEFPFVGFTDGEGSEKELYLEPCVIENYTPYRAGQKSFGAYYFAESQELYIPASVTLALFEEDETITDIYDGSFVVRYLDLQPQTVFDEFMSKATVEGKSYYGDAYGYSHDKAMVFLADEYIYVKGADCADEEAWVEFAMDDSDETLFTVFENQYIATYFFYTDATRTDTFEGVIVTVGLLQENGKLTAFNSAADYSSSYKWTDNIDETSTLRNTDGTVYGDYIFAEDNNNAGMYNAVDLSINILYETPDAITNIKTQQKQNDAIYSISGQRVGKDYKGIVVKNGKKFLQK